MADVFSLQKRREVMASISAKNTKPELLIRKALHRKGFRYRLHDKCLPGKPDLVFRGFNAVVFVNGCFWHGHDCQLFKVPATNREFWETKIETNRARDARNKDILLEQNWRVLIVWECSTRGKGRLEFEELIANVTNWLKSDEKYFEIRGLIH